MKTNFKLPIILLALLLISSCAKKTEPLINAKEVSPWCIRGFDVLDRTPEQRIALLKEMGFSKYGFNKGNGQVEDMKKEFQLATDNDIEIASIFLWLNAERDSIGKLSASNQELLKILKVVDQKPTIWLSFSDNYFKGKTEKESLDIAMAMIEYIKLQADDAGCHLALYNHHGWFGNPYNQIKILESLNIDAITMVYNFHHAQDYVDDFPDIAAKMQPYLSYVNINGVKKEGPQIITVGEGDYEYKMIKTLKNTGFNGPWGILGHIKTEDVKEVLNRNMDGLAALNAKYTNEENH